MSLEEYDIIKQLGQGSFSIVYQVRCKKTKKDFAMKEIKLDKLSAKEKEYTKTEVKILKQIRHPNIIKFEDSFTENGKFYIIMELATNGDLQQRISNYSEKGIHFSIDTIWNYIYQIVSGLQALHGNNIIHRDIKASNVFIMENDLLKIGDFNVGKEFIQTLILTKIGTPVTMSPEAWNGEAYNFKTDIWSLGCLVYQIAALKLPFVAENYAALYMKITKLKYEKLTNYPKVLNLFIEKLLQRKPKQRPTCGEILQFDELKRYREVESAETVKEATLRKTKTKLNIIARESNKDSCFIKKIGRFDFSPLDNNKLIIHRGTKSFNKDASTPESCVPVVQNKRILKNVSPSPILHKHNIVTHKNLFHDQSLDLLSLFDLKTKKKTLIDCVTSKYASIENSANRTSASKSPNIQENSPRNNKLVTNRGGSLQKYRIKRIEKRLTENSELPIVKKRNIGSMHIQKKNSLPLKKVFSAKKLKNPGFC
jgi:NIMA (never in mitosis gene a)-related kinase 1/4/5